MSTHVATTVAARVTVGTSATALDQDTSGPRSLLIYNNGSNTMYIGGSGVTTAAGFPLTAGSSLSVDVPRFGGGVYGIVAAATEEAAVLQIGQVVA